MRLRCDNLTALANPTPFSPSSPPLPANQIELWDDGPRRDYRGLVSRPIAHQHVATDPCCIGSREGEDQGSGREDGGDSTHWNAGMPRRYSLLHLRPLSYREFNTWQVKEAFELLWITGFHQVPFDGVCPISRPDTTFSRISTSIAVRLPGKDEGELRVGGGMLHDKHMSRSLPRSPSGFG